MEDSSDIMLPYWWIVKHGALSGITEENDKLQFTSKHCHQHCTKAAVSSFSIEYDDSILKFGTDPRWIGVIGSMHVSAAHEIEIDWVERIPWQYRDFQTIYNGKLPMLFRTQRTSNAKTKDEGATAVPSTLSERSFRP
jgi:hypothetical protein